MNDLRARAERGRRSRGTEGRGTPWRAPAVTAARQGSDYRPRTHRLERGFERHSARRAATALAEDTYRGQR